jgi:hypothetical protein
MYGRGSVKEGNSELEYGWHPLQKNEYRNLKQAETTVRKGVKYNEEN